MATSGSYDYTLTRDTLIRRAFQIVGVYQLTETVGSDDLDFAKDILNSMIKQWQAEGLKLWNRREATLFSAYQTASYSLGSTGTHATNSYVSTAINGALTSGATSITVDSTTGMTAADNISFKLADNTRQWTTIASVDSSTTLTIDDALTGNVADDTLVFSYTTKMQRPLQVISVRWQDKNYTSEIPLDMVRHEEYFEIPDKTTDGASSLFYYDKQLDNGVIYLWARPDNVDYIFNLTYYEQLEDMDAATDNFDFPQEWTLGLMYNLAELLAIPYGHAQELQMIQPKAQELKAKLEDFNHDEASLLISPTLRPNSRIVREL